MKLLGLYALLVTVAFGKNLVRMRADGRVMDFDQLDYPLTDHRRLQFCEIACPLGAFGAWLFGDAFAGIAAVGTAEEGAALIAAGSSAATASAAGATTYGTFELVTGGALAVSSVTVTAEAGAAVTLTTGELAAYGIGSAFSIEAFLWWAGEWGADIVVEGVDFEIQMECPHDSQDNCDAQDAGDFIGDLQACFDVHCLAKYHHRRRLEEDHGRQMAAKHDAAACAQNIQLLEDEGWELSTSFPDVQQGDAFGGKHMFVDESGNYAVLMWEEDVEGGIMQHLEIYEVCDVPGKPKADRIWAISEKLGSGTDFVFNGQCLVHFHSPGKMLFEFCLDGGASDPFTHPKEIAEAGKELYENYDDERTERDEVPMMPTVHMKPGTKQWRAKWYVADAVFGLASVALTVYMSFCMKDNRKVLN